MSRSVGPVLAAVFLFAVGGARAMTLSSRDANVVELLSQSSDIVVGTVDAVTDGIDERGIQYTEVTLEITESIRGGKSGAYRFRQFGLLSPRLAADGKRRMMPAPAGFPKYTRGEHVVLFLRPAAAWTGFRMPAGVTRGKFSLGPGRVANEMGNAGLFENVRLEKGLVTASEKRMMAVGGPANPDTFLSFVRRAVHERWVETGRMTRGDGKGQPSAPPPSDPNDSGPPSSGEQPAADRPPEQLDPNANHALGRTGR